MNFSQCTKIALPLSALLLIAVSGAAHKNFRGRQGTKDHPRLERRLHPDHGELAMKEYFPRHVRKLVDGTCGINNPELVVAIFADNFADEVSWSLTEVDGSELLSVGTSELAVGYNVAYFESTCLEPDQCYNFVINDSWGDGLSTGFNGYNSYNLGFYSLTLDGHVIKAGKDYEDEDLFDFCLDEEGTFVDPEPCSDAFQKVELTVESDFNVDEVGYSMEYVYNVWELAQVFSAASGDLETPFYPYQHSGCLPRPIIKPECLRFSITDTFGNGITESENNPYGIGGYDIRIDGETAYSGADYGSGTEEFFCSEALDPSEYDCQAEYDTSFTWRYGLTTQKCDYWLKQKLQEYPQFCLASASEPNKQLRELCPGVCQKVC